VDDRELAELLAFGPRSRDYVVEVASDGSEALSLLDERRFDAMVPDWYMPVMGGEEFLKEHQLRCASIPPTPIVVITASPDAEQRAQQVGAVAVVPKPFNLDELVGVLVPVLGDAQ
jgi:CheY-like chemotaxis protein